MTDISAGPNSIFVPPTYYTPQAAANYLGLSKSYLDKLRLSGGGPKFARLGNKAVRYARADLDAWFTSRTVGSTSEAA